MKANDRFKLKMRGVKEAVKHVAREAERGGETGSHINVSRRTNIQVARNIRRDGGTAHASASQEAPIVQDGTGATAEGTDRDRPSGS